ARCGCGSLSAEKACGRLRAAGRWRLAWREPKPRLLLRRRCPLQLRRTSSLELHLQTELQNARAAVRRGDPSEVAVADRPIGKSQVDAVESVEKLGTEHQPGALPELQPEHARDAQVRVLEIRAAQDVA